MKPGAGFTLIEILVVLGIIVLTLGMVTAGFPRTDRRVQQVKAAAEELAATCRQARALSLSRNAAYAVVFNIQNDPAANGRVLNNRSGGHWYRIVGPTAALGSTNGNSRQNLMPDKVDNVPPVVGSLNGTTIFSSPFNLLQMSNGMASGWAGETHALPAAQVRFVALTDMDYGDFTTTSTRRVPSAGITYPRPWFGWWDKSNAAGGGAGRLYGWGGYDPAIPGSGFYYWGSPAAAAYAPLDAQPVNSANAALRTLDRWVDGQQAPGSGGASTLELPAFPGADVLYQGGTPRPLVNGAWRDMSILFCPTGEVRWGGTLPGRHCSEFKNSTVLGTPVFRGAAERCNGTFDPYGMVNQHTQAETGNFERDSGGFFITLGPDLLSDRDIYASAQEAEDALMPLFRVFVSLLGEVRVIAVSRSSASAAGRTLFPTGEAWWRNGTNMKLYFGQDRLVTGSKVDTAGTGIGDAEPGGPITGFLTPEMLTNRAVWLK